MGFIFFAIVPANMIGWAIMPIGTIITLWVLFNKIHTDSFSYYLSMVIMWVLIAIVFGYFFIVKMLNPADGYYKLDVCLYYLLIFVLPVVAAIQYKRAVQK